MVEEVLKQYIAEKLFNKSKNTIDTYARSLRQFLTWVEDSGLEIASIKENKDGLTRLEMQDFVRYLEKQKKKSPQTVNKDWAAIVSFMEWKGLKELTEDISLPKFEKYTKTAPGFLEDAIIKKIKREEYRKAERTGSWRDAAIIEFLVFFGIRIEELVSLDLSSIELSDRKGNLHIVGKRNKHRDIPFPKAEDNRSLREIVSKYLSERLRMQTDEEALFISNRGNRLSKRAAQLIVEKHNVNCHAFRHTYITKLVRQGVDIPLIMSLTGHSSAEMIARYSKPTEENRMDAQGKVNFDV
ncbi:tyrosine-type recombinase/integrase [Bacillus cereus group sp. TH260-2LC]|uniref:tyrosine-type recombinase/integrase n=1 Tax=Bacillus cereus group sp. TH260-2LC TaxID=3018041 RepID=UPI00119CBCCD|nr:tyrosine-type recombinase/integrase [Bacillus cereus group sp. TH260-2LC]MDA1531994.1 tyrosine-type recombinase/integrase [Bacillus cereus group sp. TH260-2LC]